VSTSPLDPAWTPVVKSDKILQFDTFLQSGKDLGGESDEKVIILIVKIKEGGSSGVDCFGKITIGTQCMDVCRMGYCILLLLFYFMLLSWPEFFVAKSIYIYHWYWKLKRKDLFLTTMGKPPSVDTWLGHLHVFPFILTCVSGHYVGVREESESTDHLD
jgi:hypothetical protein